MCLTSARLRITHSPPRDEPLRVKARVSRHRSVSSGCCFVRRARENVLNVHAQTPPQAETVAVVQLATRGRFPCEATLSRALPRLLTERLNTPNAQVRATFVELRPAAPTDDASETSPWAPLYEDHDAPRDKVVCRAPMEHEALAQLAAELRASWWLTGWLEVDEPAQRFSLDLALGHPGASVDIPGQPLAPAPEASWERSFEGELDELASSLNAIAAALIEAISGAVVAPEELIVETRHFGAMLGWCAALDAVDAEQRKLWLAMACHDDPHFLEPLFERAIDALDDEDQAAFDALLGDILVAAQHRPRHLAARLVALDDMGCDLALYRIASFLAPVCATPHRVWGLAALAALRMGPPATEDVFTAVAQDVAPADCVDVQLAAAMSALTWLYGNPERAERWASAALALGGDGERAVEALYALGSAHRVCGDFTSAARWLEQALGLAPERADVRGDLAGAYMCAGRAEDTIALLEDRCGTHATLWSNLALALSQRDALVEAERAATAATEHDPAHPQAWAVLGEVRRRRGDLERAERALALAQRLDPSNPFWHRELGRVLFAMGDHQRALEHFGVVIEHQPELARSTPEILFVMANMAERERGFDAAQRLLHQALALDPDFWQAANNLAVLLMRRDRFAEAAHWLRHALELAPDNEGIRRNLQRAIDATPGD